MCHFCPSPAGATEPLGTAKFGETIAFSRNVYKALNEYLMQPNLGDYMPYNPCLVNRFRHKTNPLHVYVRLRDENHLDKGTAMGISRAYENYLYKPLNACILNPLHYIERCIRNGNGKRYM